MLCYKNIYSLVFVFCFLLARQVAHGQKEELKNRWIVGTDIGINLYLDCSNCNERSPATSSFSTNGFVHYRIIKMLGLTANIGYHRLQSYDTRSASSIFTSESVFAQSETRLNYTHISAGPSLMYRIGQGDLALEFRLGSYFRNARVLAISSEDKAYDIKYKTKVDRYSALKLGYTYWPKQNFGLNISVESANAVLNGFFIADEPRTPFEELYPNEDENFFNAITPSSSGAALWMNLLVGVVYRFK